MNPNEILDFLLPHFDDPLQIIFLLIIVSMTGFAMISTFMYARPASWERKWTSGSLDNTQELDIEHGSVTDLWLAVATGQEKLAEIMPGMLLVVGLLGTFISLGMALNHASQILGQPNALSAGAAANSMQDLFSLLQGLGTKFKTSTWGIMGFLLLKIWSEFTRFDEKRLTWVIRKVKADLERRKLLQAASDAAKEERLLANIGEAANGIVHGFAQQVDLLMENEKTLHQKSFHYFEQSVNEVRKDLGHIYRESHITSDEMIKFSKSTQSVIENMGRSAQGIATGAEKVGSAASKLEDTVRAFENKFTETLDKVRIDLGSAIHDMSTQASDTLEKGSTQLGNATREISRALEILSKDVRETMSDVKDSVSAALEMQKKAAIEFTNSNSALNEYITATTGMMEKLATPIQLGLHSVSESTQRMRGLGISLEKSIASMEKVVFQLEGLGSALEPIKSLAHQQKQLASELKSFGRISDNQIAILQVLSDIRQMSQPRNVDDKNAASALMLANEKP